MFSSALGPQTESRNIQHKYGVSPCSSIPRTGLRVNRLAFFLFGQSPEKKTGGEKEKVLFLCRAFLPYNP